MTVVDVASRYKEAEPLTSKIASQVADAIKKIYGRSPLTWPAVARVDAGTEFKGEFKQLFRAKNVELFEGVPGVHRSQGIVERFNRTLAERLFGHQYAQEMLNPQERNVEWVERLPRVVKALNEETTRLIQTEDGRDLTPARAIELSRVKQLPASRETTEVAEIPPNAVVRYLYQPGEQEGGTTRRATDPVWSVDAYQIEKGTSQFKTKLTVKK